MIDSRYDYYVRNLVIFNVKILKTYCFWKSREACERQLSVQMKQLSQPTSGAQLKEPTIKQTLSKKNGSSTLFTLFLEKTSLLLEPEKQIKIKLRMKKQQRVRFWI